MRTLSARILLGFTALTIAFGVITATVVLNMREVENEAKLIGNGYMVLTLRAKDLFNREDQLYTYLDAIPQARSELVARRTLKTFHDNREKELHGMMPILDGLESLADIDPRGFAFVRPKIEALETAAGANEALYKKVLDAPPVGATDSGDSPPLDARHQEGADALKQWKVAESRVKAQTSALAQDIDHFMRTRVENLQDNEHIVRMRTIYLGIVAIVLGLLVTSWVVITLRPLRRLREGARRVAAGDYGSRLPERGPTEVVEIAREFNAMGSAVQERERQLVRSERLTAMGLMAASVAHEVRNPLSAISLNTELLADDHVDTAEARELCRAIIKEVDRLAAFAEECLTLGKLPDPKIGPESINKMVGALAAFVREDLAAKQVKLDLELASADPIALVDAAQIRQCLVNLLRNAAEAVVAKGSGTITIRTRRRQDRIEIAVTDDGIGIPPDVAARLFDPISSTKKGGSGLGLTLTQQIVKDHGGELTVASTVGAGTTFTVSVPAAS